MIYVEQLDLGSHKECDAYILASDGKVTASLLFYYNGKCSHHIVISKDTDADVVKVSHKGKRFPEYVKRVLNVLSRLVLPSIYHKECVF